MKSRNWFLWLPTFYRRLQDIADQSVRNGLMSHDHRLGG